jgi:1,2-diacylglycerol-3-alpha-glucose alpha-1,2-galactosyltransferase
MDYLVTVNPYFKNELVKYGIDKNKIHYIPNFVSENDFYRMTQPEIDVTKRHYDIDLDKFVVLGVGQIQKRKGVLDFIEVAKLNPDIQFVWAGGFSFGLITDGYDELSKVMKNPPSNVTFLGIVDRHQMNAIYNMSDVLFMPSYNELFPMAILEAMSCGKPLLLRDIDVYKGILYGYYKKGSSVSEFSTIIRSLSTDSLYYREAMSQSFSGSKFYSRNHILKQWEDFYNKVYHESIENK